MDTRSANVVGYTHFTGDVTAHVGSSHGTRLSGGSTGGILESVGDDANVALKIRGKGTGAVELGNSSSPVRIGGSAGSAIAEARGFMVEFTAPTLSSGVATGIESTYTVAGVSTGAVLMFTPVHPINAKYNVRARCSTANELTLAWSHDGTSTLGSGESSNRGVLMQFRIAATT